MWRGSSDGPAAGPPQQAWSLLETQDTHKHQESVFLPSQLHLYTHTDTHPPSLPRKRLSSLSISHWGLCTHQSLGNDCVYCSQCPLLCRVPENCSDEGITRCYAKLVDSSQKDDINTKSAFFSCQQVRIMAFLYATPATQNNSLLTIAAIPGIPQNRKCCFIYNKLLGMIKQSMSARWAGALCTAPCEPAFPERLLIKVNILYTPLPKRRTVSKCLLSPFFSFYTNASIVLLKSTEYRGQNMVTEVDSPKMKGGVGVACLHLLCFLTIHC